MRVLLRESLNPQSQIVNRYRDRVLRPYSASKTSAANWSRWWVLPVHWAARVLGLAPFPKALRTHTLRLLGPKSRLHRAFVLFG